MQVQSLGWEDLWRRRQQPIPIFLPGKSQGQRSLADYSPWSPKRVGHNLAIEHACTYEIQSWDLAKSQEIGISPFNFTIH